MQIRDGFAQDADLVAVALMEYHGLVLGVGWYEGVCRQIISCTCTEWSGILLASPKCSVVKVSFATGKKSRIFPSCGYCDVIRVFVGCRYFSPLFTPIYRLLLCGNMLYLSLYLRFYQKSVRLLSTPWTQVMHYTDLQRSMLYLMRCLFIPAREGGV